VDVGLTQIGEENFGSYQFNSAQPETDAALRSLVGLLTLLLFANSLI
jgi:hypothetical protein